MEIKYSLVRSGRKTIALEVKSSGVLIVRAPYRANSDFIENLVQKKTRWITQKIQEALSKKNAFRRKNFTEGEKILYLGKERDLIITDGNELSINEKGEFLLPRKIIPLAAFFISNWYKRSAKRIIKERTDLYVCRLGLSYGKIKITGAKSRWGSCSYGNNLNFSWRLVMAPLEIIDYVVVHEITHLVEKNHSKNFWDKVAAIIPDFYEKRKWLRDNGHLLDI